MNQFNPWGHLQDRTHHGQLKRPLGNHNAYSMAHILNLSMDDRQTVLLLAEGVPKTFLTCHPHYSQVLAPSWLAEERRARLSSLSTLKVVTEMGDKERSFPCSCNSLLRTHTTKCLPSRKVSSFPAYAHSGNDFGQVSPLTPS